MGAHTHPPHPVNQHPQHYSSSIPACEQEALAADKPEDEKAQQWRITLSIISLLLLASGATFLLAAYQATPAADFRHKAAGAGAGEEGAAREEEEGGALGPGGGGTMSLASSAEAAGVQRPLLDDGLRQSDDAAGV